ncbi:hypothetical protein D9M68_809750 [compost metagenome]
MNHRTDNKMEPQELASSTRFALISLNATHYDKPDPRISSTAVEIKKKKETGDKKKREKENPLPVKEKSQLKEIDDEKIIPGIRSRRRPWNSVTFDPDELMSGKLWFTD